MNSEKIKLLAVVGPTASGKTALAVEMAKTFDGEVISCDSMQIYKGMEIATAAPNVEEQCGIPHHMVSCVSPEESFSVSKYCDMAHRCIEEISGRGKLPVLCGGTGLYYSSLVDDITFVDAPSDDGLRSRLYERAKKEGGQALLDELSRFDPETASRLHPNHISRIVRAMEIFMLSGVTLTEQNKRSRQNGSRYDLLPVGLDFHDRAALYERIDKRVDIMLKKGLIDEARMAYNGMGKTSVQAIGHKELWKYFDGTQSLECAIETLKRQTRRYAKRQLTWFRRDERIKWFDAMSYPDVHAITREVTKIVIPWLGGNQNDREKERCKI